MPDSLRLFIGLAPAPATRQALQNLQASLALPTPAQQVTASNLHLTLAFLGQTQASRQDDLLELLADMSPLDGEVALDRLDEFDRAGVVWAGCSKPLKHLDDYVASLRQRLAAERFGFDPQPFRLHVTLFRKARILPQEIAPPVLWPLAAPQLYVSNNTPRGPEYQPVRAG